MNQNTKNIQYVLSYYYFAGEPNASGFDTISNHKTYNDAKHNMIIHAKELLKDLKEDEEEKLNELRKLSENKNIKVKETETKIILERQNQKISYNKVTYKMKHGINGLVVGNLKGNGDENNFHFGGYDSNSNYYIYKISTMNTDPLSLNER